MSYARTMSEQRSRQTTTLIWRSDSTRAKPLQRPGAPQRQQHKSRLASCSSILPRGRVSLPMRAKANSRKCDRRRDYAQPPVHRPDSVAIVSRVRNAIIEPLSAGLAYRLLNGTYRYIDLPPEIASGISKKSISGCAAERLACSTSARAVCSASMSAQTCRITDASATLTCPGFSDHS